MSLLPGVTPGVHPGYARYMIRRMRIAANHALVDVCRSNGYHVEYVLGFDGAPDYSTVVVEFPFSYPENTVLAADVTAVDQLNYVRRAQTEWSDNAVSCTVYYKQEELDGIREYLKKNYNDSCKSISFLLHSGHGFAQAPYEEITKEQYDELVGRVTPITSVEAAADLGMDAADCATGSCPVR